MVGGTLSAAALGIDSTVNRLEVAVKPSRVALTWMELAPRPVPVNCRLSPTIDQPAGKLPTIASVATGLPGSDRKARRLIDTGVPSWLASVDGIAAHTNGIIDDPSSPSGKRELATPEGVSVK